MRNYSSFRGFTLVEMLIVISIISILAAIAYPSYRSQILKSERTEAKTALADTAQRLERCYTQFNVYNDTDDCTIASELDDGGFDTEEGHYGITATTLNATSFTLKATRKDGDDDRCGDFVLNNLGQRGAKGTMGSDPNDCW